MNRQNYYVCLHTHTHTDGPYLISTTINEKTVYWKVNQEQLTLIGTEDIKAASLFYITSAGNQFYPADFTIAYWGDKRRNRNLITEISSRSVKLRPYASKLPIFLTTNTPIFGSSSGPLKFKYTFDIKTAQYTIHSRIYSSVSCFISMAGPASLQTWLEGDEFYIKHHPYALKNEYLALKLENDGAQSSSYTSTTFPNIKDRDQKNTGMLFRLHPFQLRIMYGRIAPTEEVLLSLLPGGSD